jgi:hypothetical protein
VDLVTLRKSVVPAAFALAGCLAGESEPPPSLESLTYQTPEEGGACEVERVRYQLHGTITAHPTHDKSRTSIAPLLVSFSETTSVVHCDEDLMRVATPGAELDSKAFAPDFAADTQEFTFEVPGAVIGGHRPSFYVRALVDENDNGRCDDGELVGFAELTDAELGNIAIELSGEEGCPTRS